MNMQYLSSSHDGQLMAITFLPTQYILLSIHPFIRVFIFQTFIQLFMMKIF